MQIKLIEAEACGKIKIEISSGNTVSLLGLSYILLPIEITEIGIGNSIEIPNEFIQQIISIPVGMSLNPVEWLLLHKESVSDVDLFISAVGSFFEYKTEEEVEWYQRLENTKGALY